MQLHNTQAIVTKKKRRLGQGHGSGRVKTSGRGMKGQKARGKVALSFEGGALSLIKRMPFRRGKGKNHSLQEKPIILNVQVLNILPKNSTVDIETLLQHHLVEEEVKRVGVKILGNGELQIPLVVKLPVSKSAAEKIEQAGGRVELAS